MLIIIASHFCVHGVLANEPFSLDNASWQRGFTVLVGWGGGLGNAIFVMISGYFMIHSKVHWKKNVKLLFTMFVFSWGIGLFVYGGHFWPVTMRDFFRTLFPIWFGENWFVSCYLIFSLFLPFINPFLRELSQKKFRTLIVLLFFVYAFMPAFKGNGFSNAPILFFGLCYCIGAYGKRFLNEKLQPDFASGYGKYAFLILGSFMGISLISMLVGLQWHIAKLLEVSSEIKVLFSIPLAVYMVYYFAARKPFYSRWINRIAASVLGVYLIHDNLLMRTLIWKHIFPNLDYISSSYFVLFFLAKVAAVFVLCTLADMLMGLWIRPVFERLWSALSSRYGERVAGLQQRLAG